MERKKIIFRNIRKNAKTVLLNMRNILTFHPKQLKTHSYNNYTN